VYSCISLRVVLIAMMMLSNVVFVDAVRRGPGISTVGYAYALCGAIKNAIGTTSEKEISIASVGAVKCVVLIAS
jgi:hypothetical protein